jgi:hypothetical protein
MMIRLMRLIDGATKQKKFNVHFLTWDSFFNAMVGNEGHQDILQSLFQVDCIIGGVDMTVSYL